MKKVFLGLMAASALLFTACEEKGITVTEVELPDGSTVKVDPAKEDYTRTVMLEQFTGQACKFCPEGADNMKKGIQGLEDRVVWTAHHSGFGTDEFTIANSTSMNQYLGINGAPAVVIDRTNTTIDYNTKVEGKTVPQTLFVHTPTGFTGANFKACIEDRLAKAGEASVNIKTKLDGNTLKVTVYGAVKEPQTIRITAYVQEDGLVGEQLDYRLPEGKQDDYVHNNVPRGKFMTVPLGEKIALDGQVYHRTFTMTMESGWKAENCKVVAFVTKDKNYRPVLNAASVPVK